MSDVVGAVRAVRRGVGLFDMTSARGLVEVGGEDRARWLGGMLSNDVEGLRDGPEASGCYAALLTPQGRVVSDLHVLHRGAVFWLELARAAVPDVIERLGRYVIADDVVLRDVSDEFVRYGLEGPRARPLLEAAAGRPLRVAVESVEELAVGGAPVVVAAFGWSGEDALQLFVRPGDAPVVRLALRGCGEAHGLVEPEARVLETLRIEAGIPAFGSELALDTLPDEAGIGHAISTTKGCYTGQEVVARLRSRGGVKHRMVGLRLRRGAEGPAPGTRLLRAGDGSRTGEITSVAESEHGTRSPHETGTAWIALGFVHRDDAAAGTVLMAGDAEVEVVVLPFVRAPLSLPRADAAAAASQGAPASERRGTAPREAG